MVLWVAEILATSGTTHGAWWTRRSSSVPPLPDQSRLQPYLSPATIDGVTVSRDGRHLAVVRVSELGTNVDVIPLEAPEQRFRFSFGDLEGARVIDLQWTSPVDLVVAVESGALVALNLEVAGSMRTLLTPTTFAEDEVVLPETADATGAPIEPGWVTRPRWPRLLHPASNENSIYVEGVAGSTLRDATAEIFRVDVRTGRRTRVDSVGIRFSATRLLADRSGRYRLIEDRSRLPLQWQVRANADRNWFGWRRLEQVFAPDLRAGFNTDQAALLSGRSFPLGFGADDNVLYFASNVGRTTTGLYSVDVATGQRTEFSLEDPAHDLAWPEEDLALPAMGTESQERWRWNAATYYTGFRVKHAESPLVFDRASGELLGLRGRSRGERWLHPVFLAVQAELDRWFPGREVRLLDADDRHERFAVHVFSVKDPGRYFVYHRSTRRCVEYLRRIPGLPLDRLHSVETFEFTQAGLTLRGRLTLPRQPLVQPAPVVCLLQDDLWLPSRTEFDRLSQLLAELGCRVLQLDEVRANPLSPTTATAGPRLAPDQQAASAWRSALAWLDQRDGNKPRRAVAIGTGYSGWLALRVAQQIPERFRGVVAFNGIDSPADLIIRPKERELPDRASSNMAAAKEAIAYMDALRADLTGGNGDPTAEDQTGSTGLGHQRLQFLKRQLDPTERPPVHLFGEIIRMEFAGVLANEKQHSVSAAAHALPCPVLLVHDADHPYWPLRDARRLKNRLETSGQAVDLWTVPPPRWDRPLNERVEAWSRVSEWLHEVLYRYEVDVGEAREVKS